jgi:osmotically-inducible protein OsmY
MVLLLASGLLWVWGCTTPAGRTPGQVFDDGAITTTVKTKIYASSELRGLGISVKTFKREVTLTGAVENKSERKKVEKLAKSIKGVKKVHNRIKIQ